MLRRAARHGIDLPVEELMLHVRAFLVGEVVREGVAMVPSGWLIHAGPKGYLGADSVQIQNRSAVHKPSGLAAAQRPVVLLQKPPVHSSSWKHCWPLAFVAAQAPSTMGMAPRQ